jgi:hypothetical protein
MMGSNNNITSELFKLIVDDHVTGTLLESWVVLWTFVNVAQSTSPR